MLLYTLGGVEMRETDLVGDIYPLYLGRDSARLHQCAPRHFARGTEQRRSTVWCVPTARIIGDPPGLQYEKLSGGMYPKVTANPAFF